MKLKFKYGQEVRVIDGFYEGQRGIVVGYHSEFWSKDYEVNLKKIDKVRWFQEKYLESCGKPDEHETKI